MNSNAFFSDLLTSISERGRNLLRRGGSTDGKQEASDLIELCEALLSGRGEASGTAMAREVLDRYRHLDEADRLAFFATLARNFGPDAKPQRGGSQKGKKKDDQRPRGPIPVKTDRRSYSLEDDSPEVKLEDFDDFATSKPGDEPDDD